MDVIALDHLPDAVVVLDRDGSVLAINDRAGAVLGLTGDAVGHRIAEVLDLRDDSGNRCELPPSGPVFGARLSERVLRVVDGAGRRRPVAITARRTTDGWVITARSAARRELLERVQGDVVATVSHEIRAPLASVKGFTRTLLSRWDRLDDDSKRAMLTTIDADADRVTRLLSDLLEVSRIDAGRVRLRRAPVDLGRLVDEVVDKARHRDNGRDRELHVTIAADLPLVEVDRDRIEQALTNLVDNALLYAPDGVIAVTLAADGDGVRITVTDEGPGVPPDLRESVFEKFGRGRAERRPGTGLGLYIGRGLVRAHGGRLWLEPSTALGSAFHLWLPLAAATSGRPAVSA